MTKQTKPPKPFEPYDLDDAFEGFMRRAYPGLPEHATQYMESRRIFIAGIASLYFHTMEVTLWPEKRAMAELKSIDDQLTDFFKHQIGFNR